MTYPFNNKEEYLAYRKMWKAEYKELTQTIRNVKRARTLYQRAWAKAYRECHEPGMYRNFIKTWNLTKEYLKDNQEYQELNKRFNPSNSQRWTYPDRERLKSIATQMLEDLKGAKIEAQRQYMEQHQLVEV